MIKDMMKNKRLWLWIGISLCLTSLNIEATKALVIAIDLKGVIDASNVIDPNNSNGGALYDAVNAINTTIIDPLNQVAEGSSQQVATYRRIGFHQSPDLHMTLAYVGYLAEKKENEYESIVSDLKQTLSVAIKKWLAERTDKSAMECYVDTLMWPPMGNEGLWVSYGVQVRNDDQKDMLRLINTIQKVLIDLGQEWFAPFVDTRNGQHRFYRQMKSLENARLHVSVARFTNGYQWNRETQSVFGLPSSAANKRFIDAQFQALPPFKKADFQVNNCSLYMKDEQHQVHVLETFSLAAPQKEKVAEKLMQ